MERRFLYLAFIVGICASAIAQPTAPANLRVHMGSSDAAMEWDANPPAEAVISYHIYRSTDRVAYQVIDSTAATSFTDTGLDVGQTYFYHVRARNATGLGPASELDAGVPQLDHGRFAEFDGVDDSIHIANSDELQFAATSFSIDFWVRPRSFPAGSALDNLVGRFPSGTGDGYMLRINSSGQLDFRIASFLIGFTTVESLQLDEWQHITLTFYRDASPFLNEAKVYIDGVEATPQAAALVVEAPATPGGSFVIAGDPTGNQRFFDGYMDEVRAWDYDLTAVEVNQIRCERKLGNEVGLVGLWHFDEDAYGKSPSVFDHSVNNNHGGGSDRLVDEFVPVAIDDRDSTLESTALMIAIQDNDTSASGKALTASLVPGLPANGSVSLDASDSILTYTPNAGFTGIDSVQYVLCEESGICSAEGTYQPRCDTATVVFYVQCPTKRNLDWDDWGLGQDPSDSVIIDDGIRLEFAMEDPLGVVTSVETAIGPGGNGLLWQQDEASNTEEASMLVTFTRAVEQLTFEILDINQDVDNEDRLTLNAYSGGALVSLTSGHYGLGADVDYMGSNTFAAAATTSADPARHRVRFILPEAVDSLRILFQQGTAAADPSAHDIFIGDFSWCQLDNTAPYASDGMGGSVDTLYFSATTAMPTNLCLDNLVDPEVDSILITGWSAIAASGVIDLGSSADSCVQYTSAAAFEGTEIFDLTFCDKRDPALCNSVFLSIDVTAAAVNTAPVIVDADDLAADTLWYQTNKEISLDLCLTVRDNESDPVVISSLTALDGGGQASVIAGSDTCLTFTPSNAFIGFSATSVIVCDNGAPSMCDTAVVALDVLPIAPIAVDDGYSILADTPDTLVVSANDINPDASQISVIIVSAPNNGVATVLPGSEIFYEPDVGYLGVDSLSYQICDEGGVRAGAQCSSATVVIDVAEPIENSPPQIVDSNGVPIDSLTVETVDLVPIQVCLDVQETDGDSLSLDIVNAGAITGSAMVNDPLCFEYAANPNFEGSEVLEVIVCDDQVPSLCDTVWVTVGVQAYQSPIAADDFLYVLENSSGTVVPQDNDASPLDFPLRTSIISNPLNGTAQIQNQLDIGYQPAIDYFGLDTIGYTVCDSLNLASSCAEAEVVVYIECLERTTLLWPNFSLSATPNQERLRVENIETLISLEGANTTVSTQSAGDLGDQLLWRRDAGAAESRLKMAFSSPIEQLCFTIDDLRLEAGEFADLITIAAYTGGHAYEISPFDAVVGDDVFTTGDQFFGTNATSNVFDDAVDICFFVPLDSVQITFANAVSSSSSTEQSVALSNLSWCRSDAVLPEIPPVQSTVFPSEGISPNGDGILDYWVIEGIEGYPVNSVQVFNPWGDIVFETADYDNLEARWDGRSNRRGKIGGAVLPDGVYLYVIRYPDGQSQKGHVVLKK